MIHNADSLENIKRRIYLFKIGKFYNQCNFHGIIKIGKDGFADCNSCVFNCKIDSKRDCTYNIRTYMVE